MANLDRNAPTEPSPSLGEDNAQLRRNAVRGAGASVGSEIVAFASHLVGVLVLGRLLDPRDFGAVAMVSTLYLLLMNFGINGFTEYIIQKRDVTSQDLDGLFWLHLPIALLLSSLLMALAPVLSRFYDEPIVAPVARVMSVGIPIQMLATQPLAILKREMRFGRVAALRVASGILSVTFAIACAIAGFGVWAIVVRQLSEIAVMAVGAIIVAKWRPGGPRHWKAATHGLKYALSVYGTFLLNYLSRNLDKILLGRFHGGEVLGNYDRAYHLASMPAAQLVIPLHGVGLSSLSRLREQPDQFARFYSRALSALALLGVWASVVLSVSGKDIVILLLGEKWALAGNVVQAFGLGIAPTILNQTLMWLHLSLGKPERWFRWNLISVSLIAVGLLVAAPLGPITVAYAYVVLNYVLFPFAVAYAGKPIDLHVREVVGPVLPYFLAGAAAYGATALARANLLTVIPIYSSAIGRLLLEIPIATVACLAFIVLFHRSFSPLTAMVHAAKIMLERRTRRGPIDPRSHTEED